MNRLALTILIVICSVAASAQYMDYGSKYIGLKPKTDYSPYASRTGTTINVLPFLFEYRIQDYVGVQVRPVLDFRFMDTTATNPTNIGLQLAYNKYFSDAIKRNFWIKPNAAAAFTYVYNRSYKTNVVALTVEPAVSFLVNPNFLITAGANPSLSYFIGKNGQAASGTKTGFRVSWGFFVHLGYNWFSVMY